MRVHRTESAGESPSEHGGSVQTEYSPLTVYVCTIDNTEFRLRAQVQYVRRRITGKLCPNYSHSPLYSVTYYVGRVEGEASVPRVLTHTGENLLRSVSFVDDRTIKISKYQNQY